MGAYNHNLLYIWWALTWACIKIAVFSLFGTWYGAWYYNNALSISTPCLGFVGGFDIQTGGGVDTNKGVLLNACALC